MAFADWHPDEERLLDRYLDPTERDEALERHLARCQACDRRLRSLKVELDRLHRRASEFADAAFDETRLDRQRAAVARRLGGIAPGRVLPFPAARVTAAWTSLPRRVLRPIAAAAVVLMVVGVGAGHFVSVQQRDRLAGRLSARVPAPVDVAAAVHAPEDLIFADIDLALVQPRTPELRAIDELTPHAPELVASVR